MKENNRGKRGEAGELEVDQEAETPYDVMVLTVTAKRAVWEVPVSMEDSGFSDSSWFRPKGDASLRS